MFYGDTLIDTPNGRKEISSLKEGDLFYNAIGVDCVRGIVSGRSQGSVRLKFSTFSIEGDESACVLTSNFDFNRIDSLYLGDIFPSFSFANHLFNTEDKDLGNENRVIKRHKLLAHISHRKFEFVRPPWFKKIFQKNYGYEEFIQLEKQIGFGFTKPHFEMMYNIVSTIHPTASAHGLLIKTLI